jgi:4-hydroxy-tetrahydrodipicolinate synthase
MTSELGGVIPITVTPFDDRGEIDEASIQTLVEFEIRCGVDGLNVLGIMGEFQKLTEAERRRVAACFIRAVAGRVPVVVGTSHGGTGVAIELSRAAAAAGAAAVMVAPPPGLRGDDAIVAHYRAVAGAIAIPVVVQDEPVTTGVLMSPELLVRIATELPACRYVKLEEPPTPTKITAIRRLPGGDRLRIFGGLNGLYFFEELSRGAVGIMTGIAVPDVLVRVYAAFRGGDPAGAAALYDRHASYIRFEAQQGLALALRKEVLRLRGAIARAHVRPPGPRLDDVTRAELLGALGRAGIPLA